ncbi:hypothetical protein K439DRAFT_1621314 [Ramaria rubella]|nr:hypothetical protein K439DRAFT_1621314 [Ramaria rubella]
MNASESAQVAQLEALLTLVRDSKVTIYATVASLAFLLFDYTLTFTQEVDLVWKRHLTWGKALFTRYFAILSHVFNTAGLFAHMVHRMTCDSYSLSLPQQYCRNKFTGSSNTVLWLVEFSLAVRVWLLYNRSKTVLFGLVVLYICAQCFLHANPPYNPNFTLGGITSVTTMCVKALFHQTILQRPGPFLSGCYGESIEFLILYLTFQLIYETVPTYFFNVLIAPAITTSVLLILTVYKTVQTIKEASGYQKPPMVQLLLRDGIFYFIAPMSGNVMREIYLNIPKGVLIVNIMVFHLAQGALSTFASG